jgi:hypothetical protein
LTHTALFALALLAAPEAAQVGPQPHLAQGEALEVELRGDFNADFVPDLAYVAAKEGQRALRVVLGFANETDVGELPPQVLPLDPYPLADASLALTGPVRGKVLVLSEITGGTTAIASTHRFRWDHKLGAMRLIGLDAMLYSRTFAHDGKKGSWNLLTGDLLTSTLRLVKSPEPPGQTYETVGKKHRKKRSAPVRLEDSPDGSNVIDYPYGN